MLKRVVWKDSTVLCIQLSAQLFTLAQMRHRTMLEFFDISASSPKWSGVDLNKVAPIFCIFVAAARLKPLFHSTVSAADVTPNVRAVPSRMLSFTIGSPGEYSADLVELDEDRNMIPVRVVKEKLKPETDLDTIYRYDLNGMLGDPEKLRKRLVRFFETGVNWDESKAFLFKGIAPPPAFARRDA